MTKYQQLFDALQHQILSGKFASNKRLPSESELALRHGVSRPTAARALRELQNLNIITRRAGSGSYLTTETPAAPLTHAGKTFGLLVPGLGRTEILDPICNEITRFAQSLHCTVLWGDAAQPISTGQDALALCEHYIERKVDGVFFAPMELVSDRELWNRRVAEALTAADIPLVLLDRDLLEFPHRSGFDLVGIDNFRAGMTVAQHLLDVGARKLCFLARPRFPSTTNLRMAGCREAVHRAGQHAGKAPTIIAAATDPSDTAYIQKLLRKGAPDAFICANDQTAALLLRTLAELKVGTPQDVRVAGFDDVQYSTLLAVPLTTIRQPCRELGRAATTALLDRCQDRTLPGRQVLLAHQLVVRESTGA